MIEKHFTLSRAEGGVDSAFSLEPHELKILVQESHRAWNALGKIRYGPTEAEVQSLAYRRSIYVAKDIAEGDIFSDENPNDILQRRRNTQPWLLERGTDGNFGDKPCSTDALR